jgi:hypothetical protein
MLIAYILLFSATHLGPSMRPLSMLRSVTVPNPPMSRVPFTAIRTIAPNMMIA